MEGGLTPYVPRLLPELAEGTEGPLHRVVEGTLVFADLSGFTALSEKLAAAGGKAGAEEMTEVLNDVFGELLDLAAARGGEMLKYGGDALLLLFRGDIHASQAVGAARDMQRGLRRVGNITTDLGRVRLRMSVGVHSGPIDFFVVGPHRELVVAGPVPTQTAAMESAADADEILISHATAALLPAYCAGAPKGGGVLLRQAPRKLQTISPQPHADGDLSRYIPAALRPTLAAGAVQAEHRPVTIGFFFVELGEPADPHALDDTFTSLVAIFARYDVTLMATDLAGGGVKVIAAAGLPIAQPDAEERMLRAARDALDANLPLPLRVGIQRGHVFAGTVGPPYRMTYTVIGDVVNTAARLMAQAKAGEVLTLAPVLEYSGTEFAVDELAPFVAKGKAEPLVPLRVGEMLGPRRRTDEVLPLIGRDEQLATLDDALEAIRQGAGGSIEIVGDAGMGKSRLVDEFVSHVSDVNVVRAEARELDQARPYHVAESVLRQLTRAATLADLCRLVESRASELVEWLPLLAVAMGFDCEPTPATERLAPSAVPAKIREVTAALVAASVDQPTLVVVEDVHWADLPSSRLLHALTKVEPLPLTVVVTRRPLDLVVSFGDRASVELTELPDRAAGQMLDRLAGPLLPELRAAVLARASGNPLFLRELAVSIAAGNGGDLPDRVESLIEARIDRLDLDQRIVLRAAAVVGLDFSEDDVAAALEEPIPATIWDRLTGFVAPDEDASRFRFRHALIRDSAYEGLPFRWRRTIHARVGHHLEALSNAADHTERLAVHFSAAADATRAWRYGVAAGDRARARYAFAEAANFYARALDFVKAEPDGEERFRVIDSLGVCLQNAGDLRAALGAAQRGRRLVEKNPAHRARLCLLELTCRFTQGDLEGAERALRAGLRLSRESAPGPDHVRLLVQRSRIAEGRGNLTAARRWAVAAAEVAEATDDRAGLAHALAARFDAESQLRVPGRDEIGARARELYEQTGNSLGAGNILNMLANDRERSGALREAVQAYVEAERLQLAAGMRLAAAVSAHNRALVLAAQGRVDDAATTARDVLGVFSAAGYTAGRLAAAALAAEVEAISGSPDAATVSLRALVSEFRSFGLDDDAREVEVLLTEANILAGDLDAARASMPDAEAMATPAYRARCLIAQAVVAVATGRIAQAVDLLDAAERVGSESELPYAIALAQLLRSHVTGEDSPEARAALERMGVRRVAWLDYLTSLKSA